MLTKCCLKYIFCNSNNYCGKYPSIKYLIQSKGNSAPIYLRLSLGRGSVFKRKTGFIVIIEVKKWSKTTGLPIAKDKDTKKLKEELKELENVVLKRLNVESSIGTTIAEFKSQMQFFDI